ANRLCAYAAHELHKEFCASSAMSSIFLMSDRTCCSPINALGRTKYSFLQKATFGLGGKYFWPRTITPLGNLFRSPLTNVTACSITFGARLESSGSKESKSLHSPFSSN